VFNTTTDPRNVNIADGIPPNIGWYYDDIDPNKVVLGADQTIYATFGEISSYVNLDSVKVTIDGKPAPSDKVTVVPWGGLAWVQRCLHQD
jgi:hypothetical protein